MLLAGDIGGTRTRLGLFARQAVRRPAPVEVGEFATLEYGSLAEVIEIFLRETRVAADRIVVASFGVAGAVRQQAAQLTNATWRIDASEVAARFGFRRVGLLNDLEAMGYGVATLERDDLAVLQEGRPLASGNAALIAAGTGLGEALLHNINGRFIASSSEAGHADFAARTRREIDLVGELIRTRGRAECESVVSGPGLVNIFRFTHRTECGVVRRDASTAELPALISASALQKRCAQCVESLDLFVSAYGGEAGNLALRSVATAGVYVGGGIAPKILPVLQSGIFIEAFRAKEPMTDLLATIPVSVILNPLTGLLGAAVHASDTQG